MRVTYNYNNETFTGVPIKIDRGMVVVRVDAVTTRCLQISKITPAERIKK